MNNESTHFEDLLLGNTPLIDVRAPVEFRAGSIPGSVNLPLLTDSERHEVGITYKKDGQAAAIELGHRLVSGEVREARLRAWLEQVGREPKSKIYCFRGGLRSQTVKAWLKEAGADLPLIEGGYKALRRYLLSVYDSVLPEMKFETVTGPSGAGKTEFLKKSGRPYIDLEGLANHRGSVFGAMDSAQPAQIDFENRLAVELLKLKNSQTPILIENESRMIGHITLPDRIFQKIQESPRLRLEVPLEERVENIFKDYILDSSLGQNGDLKKFVEFREAIHAISRKLGGQRSQELLRDLEAAHGAYLSSKDLAPNREWIRKLLVWYYDPRYGPSA